MALTSSPETPAGRRALALAAALGAQGHTVTLCCLQDAVLLGSDRAPSATQAQLDGLLARGARCMALTEDLALRGLRAGPQVSAADYPGIIATLAAAHERVIGAL